MDVRWNDNVLIGETPETIRAALIEAADSQAANAKNLATCLREFEDDPSCCNEHIDALGKAFGHMHEALDALGAPGLHRPEYYYESGVQTCTYDHHDFPCREAEQIIEKAKARGETPPWVYVNRRWKAAE